MKSRYFYQLVGLSALWGATFLLTRIATPAMGPAVMAATRTLLLRSGLIADIGVISLIVTIAGVVGALAIWRLALAAHANFLFERPGTFWIAPKKAEPALQPAE